MKTKSGNPHLNNFYKERLGGVNILRRLGREEVEREDKKGENREVGKDKKGGRKEVGRRRMTVRKRKRFTEGWKEGRKQRRKKKDRKEGSKGGRRKKGLGKETV